MEILVLDDLGDVSIKHQCQLQQVDGQCKNCDLMHNSMYISTDSTFAVCETCIAVTLKFVIEPEIISLTDIYHATRHDHESLLKQYDLTIFGNSKLGHYRYSEEIFFSKHIVAAGHRCECLISGSRWWCQNEICIN